MTESLRATEALSAAHAPHPEKRVSLEDLTAAISGRNYFTLAAALEALGQPVHADHDVLTICVVTMRNGFTIIGKSAPASRLNFDAEKGRIFAYEDAVRQIWPLMGFALRNELMSLGDAADQG